MYIVCPVRMMLSAPFPERKKKTGQKALSHAIDVIQKWIDIFPAYFPRVISYPKTDYQK